MPSVLNHNQSFLPPVSVSSITSTAASQDIPHMLGGSDSPYVHVLANLHPSKLYVYITMRRDITCCYTTHVSDDRDLRNGAPQPLKRVSFLRLPSPTHVHGGGSVFHSRVFRDTSIDPRFSVVVLNGIRLYHCLPHGRSFSEDLHEMGVSDLYQIDPVVALDELSKHHGHFPNIKPPGKMYHNST